jgi:hypothetical protein
MLAHSFAVANSEEFIWTVYLFADFLQWISHTILSGPIAHAAGALQRRNRSAHLRKRWWHCWE